MLKYVWFLILLTGTAFDAHSTGRAFPSSLSATVGGDDIETRFSRLDFEYFLRSRHSLIVALDQTEIADADGFEGYKVQGGEVGWASDPLQEVAVNILVFGSQVSDEWEKGGLLLGATYFVGNWDVGVDVEAEKIRFFQLPSLIFPNREAQIDSRGGGLRLGYFFSDKLQARVGFFGKTYSEDPSEFTEGLRILIVPQSVQSEASLFYKSRVNLGLSYVEGAWSFGFDYFQMKMIDGDQDNQTLQWSPSYNWNSRWLVGLQLSRSRMRYQDQGETVTEEGSQAAVRLTWLF